MSKISSLNVDINVGVNIDEVIESLVSQRDVEYEDLFEVIKSIDSYVADWDFTEMLYKYFKEQHKLFLEEEKKVELEESGINITEETFSKNIRKENI